MLSTERAGQWDGIWGVTETNEEGKATSTVKEQLRALQEANVGYARGLILTLQTMVDLKRQKGHRDLVKYAQALPSRLVSLTLSGLGAGEELSIAARPAVVADLAALLGTFVKLLDANRQRELLASLNVTFVHGQSTFTDGAEEGVSLIAAKSPLADSFAPFAAGASAEDNSHRQLGTPSRYSLPLLSPPPPSAGRHCPLTHHLRHRNTTQH